MLLLITVFLSIRHGWAGISMKPAETAMFADLGISKPVVYVMSFLTLAVGVMVLFPATFFAGNLINAVIILLIMALALQAGNFRMALTEIPFLLIPLVLICLGHPLGK
ncbi:hypothetical protein GCM10028773_28640 [Spirosoma koreense]